MLKERHHAEKETGKGGSKEGGGREEKSKAEIKDRAAGKMAKGRDSEKPAGSRGTPTEERTERKKYTQVPKQKRVEGVCGRVSERGDTAKRVSSETESDGISERGG